MAKTEIQFSPLCLSQKMRTECNNQNQHSQSIVTMENSQGLESKWHFPPRAQYPTQVGRCLPPHRDQTVQEAFQMFPFIIAQEKKSLQALDFFRLKETHGIPSSNSIALNNC